jgi:hypothetical protein
MASTDTIFPETDTYSREREVHRVHELGETEEALDRLDVADLSSHQISRMTQSELVRVVRVGGLPATTVRIEYLDRATLERLAHLACLSCRNHR